MSVTNWWGSKQEHPFSFYFHKLATYDGKTCKKHKVSSGIFFPILKCFWTSLCMSSVSEGLTVYKTMAISFADSRDKGRQSWELCVYQHLTENYVCTSTSLIMMCTSTSLRTICVPAPHWELYVYQHLTDNDVYQHLTDNDVYQHLTENYVCTSTSLRMMCTSTSLRIMCVPAPLWEWCVPGPHLEWCV